MLRVSSAIFTKEKSCGCCPACKRPLLRLAWREPLFLHARDARPMIITGDKNSEKGEGETSKERPINELVREGQTILVQALKDPIGSKGARLTTEISIPSRYLVYLPHCDMVGISQRISDETTREDLREMIQTLKQEKNCTGGYIARTTAETSQASELQQDMLVLCKLWEKTALYEKTCQAPALVYEDLPLAQRTLRDFVRDSVAKVFIDSKETFDKVRNLAQELMPDAVHIIEHYPGERPIFDLYSV